MTKEEFKKVCYIEHKRKKKWFEDKFERLRLPDSVIEDNKIKNGLTKQYIPEHFKNTAIK